MPPSPTAINCCVSKAQQQKQRDDDDDDESDENDHDTRGDNHNEHDEAIATCQADLPHRLHTLLCNTQHLTQVVIIAAGF